MLRRTFLACVLALAAGCAEVENDKTTNEPVNPAAPTVPEVVKPTEVEFRVLGDTGAATIRYGSAQEGTSQVTSLPPWFATQKTTRESIFLTVSAEAPGSTGFLQVQIIVNGQLFREASASGFDPKVAVSGLFTK